MCRSFWLASEERQELRVGQEDVWVVVCVLCVCVTFEVSIAAALLLLWYAIKCVCKLIRALKCFVCEFFVTVLVRIYLPFLR